MEIVNYIVWNSETGEITRYGKGAFGFITVYEDEKLYYGDPVDPDLYIFDLETELPVLRTEPVIATEDDKRQALSYIDRTAGEIRSRYITIAPGQELVYQQKETEANLLSTNPSVSPYEIPHIMAEADLLGVDPMEVAITIQMMAAQWRNLSAVIEFKRLQAKANVAAATNLDEVRSATEVDWNG